MESTFEGRVRDAAAAAWQTAAVALAFVVVQWLLYLAMAPARPEWLPRLWGPGATWETIRSLWFAGIAVLKLTLWLLMLAALWLSLWSRRLGRSHGDSSAARESTR